MRDPTAKHRVYCPHCGTDISSLGLIRVLVPKGNRLVLASENLLDAFGTRNERGDKITAEWNDQRPEGWYEPTFTLHRANWHDFFVMLRQHLVGTPPNVDSIDAAIGDALNECEEKIAAALGEIDPEYEAGV